MDRGVPKPAGQVHHTQNVLKARMLCGWKNPPSSLQLANLPHALNPSVIDDVPLANFRRGSTVRCHKTYVAMDRVMAQILAEVIIHRACIMYQ